MTSTTFERPRAAYIPLASAHADAPRRLQKLLGEAEFSYAHAIRRLGVDYHMWSGTTATCDKVRAYLARPAADRFDILLRFFTLGVACSAEALRPWIDEADLQFLSEMNLAARTSDGLWGSPFSLFECDGLLVVTDAVTLQTQDFNFVMPLLPESYEFAAATSRDRVHATLDLCTGSGVHALLAARHSHRVRAVDISPRAMAFSKFNRWLNQLPQVSFELGDLLAAVPGEKFDLILANPPYEPVDEHDSSPGDNYYCGGPDGSALSSRIVGGLVEHLKPNGLCQMIHMMVAFDGESHEKQLRRWLGPLSLECSIAVVSRPISFRAPTVRDAMSIDFGITCIVRHGRERPPRFLSAPFSPGAPRRLQDLLGQLRAEPLAAEPA
jgi:2-polyprenyl-3-methyl-5-hydroxy-6-metoxy-1,4-benzoquinol methylase